MENKCLFEAEAICFNTLNCLINQQLEGQCPIFELQYPIKYAKLYISGNPSMPLPDVCSP